jgi:surface antigen
MRGQICAVFQELVMSRAILRKISLHGAFIACAAIAVLCSTIFLAADPARATLGVNDYPAYLASKPQDSAFDPWGFYNRECTSFVAWRLNNDDGVAFSDYMKGPNGVTGHWGNADHWASNATAIGYSYNQVPAAGSVAYWDSNHDGASPAGHVAYVDSVSASGAIEVEDYNNSGTGGWDRRPIAAGSASWPSGFIHVRDLTPAAPIDLAATGTLRSIAVSWSPPSSGATVTSYTATAAPGGASCSTGGTSCVITGLRDDTKYSVTVTAATSSGTSPPSPPATAVPADANPDFTGAGYSDLAWLTGKASGQNTLWLFDGAHGFATAGESTGFKIPEPGIAGDFTGSGTSEIAWFRPSRHGAPTGNIYLVSWNGKAWRTSLARRDIKRPVWVGVGDFTGAGHDDLAWLTKNSAGSHTLWLLNGARRFATVGKTPGYGVPEPGTVGDFAGTGRSEIAWFQPARAGAQTGTIYLVSWSSGAWRSGLGRGPGVGRPIWVGAGNFAATGYDDLAWYTPSSSGPGTLWLLDGEHGFATIGESTDFYPPVPGVVGDFTGSGRGEIAWFQHARPKASTGTIYVVSWNGSNWQVVLGRGPGVGKPDFVATTATSYSG